jgi:hypothetical protein
VNSANFVNVLKKSPNFQYDNLKKNIGHAIPLCSHTTSIVRMPNARSLGRLLVSMVSNLEFMNSLQFVNCFEH